MRVIRIARPEEKSALPGARELPRFDARSIAIHGADDHLCVLDNGEVQAHCSLWWRHTPLLSGRRTGAIGHYASTNDEAAAVLLETALVRLEESACAVAIGPMDGNTWRRYRFVTGHGSIQPPEPSFFLEPDNPPEWPEHFELAGFAKLAEYDSALNSDLARPDERIEPAAARLQDLGLRIHSVVNADFEAELRRIYQVSRIAFVRNFLYTELAEEAFLAQYAGLLDRIRPELVLLAERGGELAGYVFAIPDFAQAARGRAIDTFIIKTVAILPDPDLRGLGGVLVGRVQQAGHRLGFRRCIHALMHADNVSRRISRHYAETIRQYSLYCREVAG